MYGFYFALYSPTYYENIPFVISKHTDKRSFCSFIIRCITVVLDVNSGMFFLSQVICLIKPQNMKNLFIILLSFFIYSASAQVSFNTGNFQLDSDLNIINTNANLDFGTFKNRLSVSYNVSERKIKYMRVSLGMKAGEIYLALEISKLSRRPIDDIITIYRRDKNKGWGYIAKQAGIKPGSAEFHQLKNNANSKKNKSKRKNKGKGKSKGKGKGKWK